MSTKLVLYFETESLFRYYFNVARPPALHRLCRLRIQPGRFDFCPDILAAVSGPAENFKKDRGYT
jgi:hypothetical protein